MLCVFIKITRAGKVPLDELADGVVVDSSVLLAEVSGLREDLINRADVGALAAVNKELDEVSANETSTTKNKNVGHCFFFFC